MGSMSLLSRLPRKGLLGSSSNGVGKMNISDGGSWTSLRKLPLLLPWRMSHTKDFKNLPSFAPVNYTLRSGNPSQRYQLGGARDLPLQTDNSQRYYLHSVAGTPELDTSKYTNLVCGGDQLLRLRAEGAAYILRGCLVSLAFSCDGKIFAELPGTMIRSDGIVATSASCLSDLKSKELKVTVDVRIVDTGETYNGVLLDAGFCSDIAFVKISSCGQHPVPKFGKSDVLRSMFNVVAAGCSDPWRGCVTEKPNYVECFMGLFGDRKTWPIIEAQVTRTAPPGVGGCLVDPDFGVVGIIHCVQDFQVKATPIEIVFKTLEHIKMHRSTLLPESDFCGP